MAGRRWFALTALLGTLAAFLTVTALAEHEGLARAGIRLSAVQTVYGVLGVLVIFILTFEKFYLQVREGLRPSPTKTFKIPHQWPAAMVGIAAIVSIGTVLLLNPSQEARLFQMPFSLWVIVVHAVGMSLLLAIAVMDEATEKRFLRIGVMLIGGLGLALGVLYVASVGEFMTLDVPDEPWLASMATNYALHDDLSPSFIAAPYGSPDPVLPRYYLLMGLWVKAVGSSLAAMRWFPVLVGVVGVGLFGWLLANIRLRGRNRLWLSHLEDDGFELAGLTLPSEAKNDRRIMVMISVSVLLGMSAYLRMSHNLRMDIGLGIYGVVMLFGLLHIFDAQPGRWPGIMGLGLLFGLESVPSIGLVLGGVAGIFLVGWAIRAPQERLRAAVVYGLGCSAALGVYLALHFLPDLQDSLAGYRQFTTLYTTDNRIGQLQFPMAKLVDYHLRFSLSLAPLELLVSIGVIGYLWVCGSQAERWMLAVFGAALVLGLVIVDMSYGYWVLFAPVAAYGFARLSRRWQVVSALVLLPALLIMPIRDLSTAVANAPNQQLLMETQAISAQIPPGWRIVGEPLFWYTMHRDWDYMGWTAVEYLMRIDRLSAVESLTALQPDAVICRDLDLCQHAWDSGLFGFPVEVVINSETYLIFLRK